MFHYAPINLLPPPPPRAKEGHLLALGSVRLPLIMGIYHCIIVLDLTLAQYPTSDLTHPSLKQKPKDLSTSIRAPKDYFVAKLVRIVYSWCCVPPYLGDLIYCCPIGESIDFTPIKSPPPPRRGEVRWGNTLIGAL